MMKLKNKLTAEQIKDHVRYHFWQYLLLFAVSAFLWNMVYVQTAYRPPKDKKIDVYIQGSVLDQTSLNAVLEKAWTVVVPDMEQVSAVCLAADPGSYMSNMQLFTYLAAGEGDIYLLCREDFKKFASQEAFIPLESVIKESPDLYSKESLASGIVSVSVEGVNQGKSSLYGIPLKLSPTLREALGLLGEDWFFSISQQSGNQENAKLLLEGLFRIYHSSKGTAQ